MFLLQRHPRGTNDVILQDRRSFKQYEAEEASSMPVKSIALAVVLLVIGIVLLTLGTLHLHGHIYSKDGAVSVPACLPANT